MTAHCLELVKYTTFPQAQKHALLFWLIGIREDGDASGLEMCNIVGNITGCGCENDNASSHKTG